MNKKKLIKNTLMLFSNCVNNENERKALGQKI